MAEGGTYTLLLELGTDATVTFGAAGDRALAAGWFAYTGSAHGPGGLARVDRHRALAEGRRDVRHWHIDHLLSHPAVRLAGATRSVGLDAECRVARSIAGADGVAAVAGIGASDCDCDTHLAGATERTALEAAVERAHQLATD